MRVVGKPDAWGPNKPVRRTAPPDRRAPRQIARGGCPIGNCFCCPSWKSRGSSHDECSKPHPPRDKTCSPPYPKNIPECPERKGEQFLPYPPPPGFRNPPTPCCIECGRITHREWTNPQGQVLPWCGGEMTKPNAIY
jgi:hypothetical protein